MNIVEFNSKYDKKIKTLEELLQSAETEKNSSLAPAIQLFEELNQVAALSNLSHPNLNLLGNRISELSIKQQTVPSFDYQIQRIEGFFFKIKQNNLTKQDSENLINQIEERIFQLDQNPSCNYSTRQKRIIREKKEQILNLKNKHSPKKEKPNTLAVTALVKAATELGMFSPSQLKVFQNPLIQELLISRVGGKEVDFRLADPACRNQSTLTDESRTATKCLEELQNLPMGMAFNPGNQLSQITDNLYIGSELQAWDLELLQSNRINTIVNVPGDFRTNSNRITSCSCFKNNSNIEYLEVGIDDVPESNLNLNNLIPEIAAQIKNGRNVLVHCREGKSRAASFTIATLMMVKSLDLSTAINLFRKQRNLLNNADWIRFQPNSGFLKQLKEFEDFLQEDSDGYITPEEWDMVEDSSPQRFIDLT